ncbi:anti-sigma factor [Variovorax sp. E3]|uniref:anti-sigma factor family protein n=1 Tax=Variovorax sp. E3 TaxID=1914993 RepID=UPI0018DBC9BA|nr:hypothetical protein [Variovorax sp. E3]
MDGRPILEEDLHAYVDDALDAPRRREVRDYLDHHPEARARSRPMRSTGRPCARPWRRSPKSRCRPR